MVNTAMIFAAGLGTRLAPLTDNKPKALVELEGKSLLQRCVERLSKAGITRIVINIHHFPELMQQAVDQISITGVELLVSDESNELLDTGGGLLKAAQYLRESGPFLVHNVDVISDINLEDMLQQHLQSKALATLAVSARQTTRYFLFEDNRLCGWRNTQTGSEINCYPFGASARSLAFSGIHMVDPGIFDLMDERGRFSINQVYLRLAAKYPIVAFEHDPRYWADLGTTDKLAQARQLLTLFPDKF